METWGTLLADIRADLLDTSDKPRWPDTALYTYVKDALRDYSTWFPRRIDRLELAPFEGKYPLPTDFIEDIQVECPIDTLLERRLDRPGVRYRRHPYQTTLVLYYLIQGGALYMTGTPLDDFGHPQETVHLTYLASHQVPANAVDINFVLTVPDSDIELIRLYVKAKVYGQMRSKTATLDRYKPVGDRQDNPLQPETEDLMGEYYIKIAQRIPGGVISLYRAGRLK
jgi:hypothetical protein